MFNLDQYLSTLIVHQDDDELTKALDHIELTQLICDDAWLARQAHYGLAGAMERQIQYLGSTLIPNSEAKITRMASSGVIGESYVVDNWFGTTNEERRHESEEVSFDQQLEDQQNFVDGLKNRMRTAAIMFVSNVRAHDELSKTLDQLTYSGIKMKASQNRSQRAA
jgi:hypothetical protein